MFSHAWWRNRCCFIFYAYRLFSFQKTDNIYFESFSTNFFYGIVTIIFFIISIVLDTKFGIFYGFSEYSFGQKIKMILPFLFIPVTGGSWWFVSAYVLLVLFSKRINEIVSMLYKRQVRGALIWIWFSLQFVIGGIYLTLIRAFFFYLLGALIRIKENKNSSAPNSYKLVVISILLWCLMSLIYYYLNTIPRDSLITIDFVKKVLFTAINSCILVPSLSCLLFHFFKNLNIRTNRLINTIASTTLGIYLIHDSSIVRQILWNNGIVDIQYFRNLFPIYAILDILAIFVLCSFMDFLRLKYLEQILLDLVYKIKRYLTYK